MPEVVLENQARFLVLLHAAGAIVLVGASTHHFLVSLGYLRQRYKIRLGRIYAIIVAIAYAATLVLGALAYPTFRYHVRGLYLDRHEVWATSLFEIKENLAVVGLPLAVGALLMSRVMNPVEDRHARLRYVAMVFVQTAIVWFNVVSGLLITMVRGV